VIEMEQVQVEARWKPDGSISLSRFIWNEHTYQVESTGRQWEDESGLHVLCQVAGGVVYELVFQLNPAGWKLRPRAGRSSFA
jgi:hypothetical protein